MSKKYVTSADLGQNISKSNEYNDAKTIFIY